MNRVSYFHPQCARKALDFRAVFQALQRGYADAPGERLDYQVGYHYPRECNGCAGVIEPNQGLITYQREGE
jgi:hypothetical protein